MKIIEVFQKNWLALCDWHRAWKRREIARLTQQLEQLRLQLGSEP